MEEEYGIKLKLDLSDFNKQVAKAKNSVKKVENQFRDIKITGLDDVKEIKIDTSSVEEVKDNLKEVADVKERIASGEIKISGLDPLKDTLSDAEYEANRLQRSLENTGKFQSDFSYLGLEELQEDLKETGNEEEDVGKKAEEAGQKIKKSFSGVGLKQKLIPALNSISSKFKTIKKDTDGFGKSIASNVTRGIKSLKRFALSLFGIQSAYRAVSKAIHSYLAYDQELSKSIQNTWVGLGSFFAPILEYLVSAFQKLLAYINALVQALTGINFVARANEKVLNKMGASAGSTAKAMKQLSGFDELNNINTDTGGGASGGGADVGQIELPEIDTDKVEQFVERVRYYINEAKQIIGTLLEPLQSAWATYGTPLTESIGTALTNIGELAKTVGTSIMEVWTNGTGEQYASNILQLWTSIFNIIGNVAKSLTIAWNNADNGTKIIQHIADIFVDISDLALSISKTLEKWTLTPEFQDMMNTIVYLFERLSYYAEKVVKWIKEKYDEWIAPLLDDALRLISKVITMIGKIWEKAEPVVTSVARIFKSNLEPVIKNVIDRMQTFIRKIEAVVDIVTGALDGNWTRVWNGMKNLAKSVINGIIDGLNGLINGINKIATPLRLIILGINKAMGKNIKFDDVKIPNIPKLSIGTDEVLTEGLAYLHAGEKVVPADVAKGGYNGSDNEETNNLLRQLITLIDEKDFEPYIKVDDIGSASVKYINKQQRITGEAII